MNRVFAPIYLLCATCLFAPQSALAGTITTYTNRATWAAATGTPAFNVDFEDFKVDSSYSSAPLDVGPFSLSTVGVPPDGRELVDVSPFIFPPVPASFGNACVDLFVQDPLAVDLAFHTPVSDFFADFFGAGNGQQLTLTLSFAGGGTADVLVPGAGTDLQPFGFISTDLVSSIRFHNSFNDGFYVDNIEGVVAPEPASLLMLLIGSGFIGLRWFGRK
jgi:hypothetical protein